MNVNADTPVGTQVRYWPGTKTGDGMLSTTRTPVFLIGNIPAVSVEGYAGGIALTHMEVVSS